MEDQAPAGYPVEPQLQKAVGEFVEQIRGTADHDQLRDIFQRTAADLGIGSFAYHIVKIAGVGEHLVRGITTYPTDWVEHYTEKNYVSLDPVVLNALQRPAPFHWHEVAAPHMLGREETDFFKEADDLGIRNGFTVPIPGRREFAMMSVVPEEGRPDAAEALRKNEFLIHMLALYYHNHASGLLLEDYFRQQMPSLTPREREVLSWIAQGKTAWEISMILRISETTVTYHVENAKQKLGVHSRPAAVVKAVMHRLIDYP